MPSVVLVQSLFPLLFPVSLIGVPILPRPMLPRPTSSLIQQNNSIFSIVTTKHTANGYVDMNVHIDIGCVRIDADTTTHANWMLILILVLVLILVLILALMLVLILVVM